MLLMPRELFPKYIIISGSGKKVGKTYMATALIRFFSLKFPVLALKISPHVHDSLGDTMLRATSEGIRIFQDLAPHEKNSGQFLQAGALESFFMETEDEQLEAAFNLFNRECNPMNHPVICESGALSRLIKPGISIFITRATDDLHTGKVTTLQQSDLVIPAKSFSTAGIIHRISYLASGWQINNGKIQ